MELNEKQILEYSEKFSLTFHTVKYLVMVSDSFEEFEESCGTIGYFEDESELDKKYGKETREFESNVEQIQNIDDLI